MQATEKLSENLGPVPTAIVPLPLHDPGRYPAIAAGGLREPKAFNPFLYIF